jgi:flagellar biosynthesis component FlhA
MLALPAIKSYLSFPFLFCRAVEDGALDPLTLNPSLRISNKTARQGARIQQAPSRPSQAIADGAERMTAVRLPLRRLCERTLPSLALLAYNEIAPRTKVRAVGQVAV